MHKRTFVGLCAALAIVAGSPGAYALKIFTEPQTSAQLVMDALVATNGSFTYAAETLLKGTGNVTPASDDSDTAMYYNIEHDVNLAAPVGVAATAGDTYVVTVTLDGMVFQDPLGDADLTGGDFDRATGGASGDKLVVYRLTEGGVPTTSAINLAANFAISGNAGTVTMTITNQTFAELGIEGVTGTDRHTGTVIKVAPGLDEDAMAMNATADVAASFKKFVDGMTAASVGSLRVGYETHRNARGSRAGLPVNAIGEIIVTDDTDGDPQSTVTFMGDFSFASRVYTHGDADCGVEGESEGLSGTPDTVLASAETGLLIRDDMDMVSDTTMTKAVAVVDATDAENALTSARHLCIMVQGEDTEGTDAMEAPRILDTSAYTAMGSYEGLPDAAVGPKPQEQTLGMIRRNGTTVRFPYLTTRVGYVQRIRIVNRGGGEAKYTLDYASNAEAIEGTDEGVLEPGERKVLVVRDVVEITGSTTTAGTLIVESQPNLIDVATTVNTADGGIDTVVYAEE